MSFPLSKTESFISDVLIITKEGSLVKRQVFSVVTFLGEYWLIWQGFYFYLQLKATSLLPRSVVLRVNKI